MGKLKGICHEGKCSNFDIGIYLLKVVLPKTDMFEQRFGIQICCKNILKYGMGGLVDIFISIPTNKSFVYCTSVVGKGSTEKKRFLSGIARIT